MFASIIEKSEYGYYSNQNFVLANRQTAGEPGNIVNITMGTNYCNLFHCLEVINSNLS